MIRSRTALLLTLPALLGAQATGPSFTLGVVVPAGPGASTLRAGGALGFGYQVALDRGWALKGELLGQTQRLKQSSATQGVDPSQETLSLSPLLAWESPERGQGSFRIFAGPGILRGRRTVDLVVDLVPGSGSAHHQTRTVNLGSRTRGFLQAGFGYVWTRRGRTTTLEARLQRVLGPDERPRNQAMTTLTFGW